MTAGLVNASPRAIQPYMKLMRLDKPVGSAFLYVPTTWSILMSSYSYNKPLPETLWNLGLFFVGSVLMRSAACTINDMADVEFDKAVERCRTRPLAAGDVSMTQAWLFLFGQLAFGLWILLSTGVNHLTIMIGVAGLIINIVYPFMKRVTYWPQLILGFAFNWGLIIGWSAVTNTIDRNVVLPMYIGGIAWTLVYDGIYAYQDLKDDVKAGVKSVAMVFGSNPIPVMIVLTLAFLGLTTYGGYQNGQGLWFYVGMAVCALHHAHILQRTDFEDPKSCWDGFAGCGWAGLWITAGAFADLVL